MLARPPACPVTLPPSPSSPAARPSRRAPLPPCSSSTSPSMPGGPRCPANPKRATPPCAASPAPEASACTAITSPPAAFIRPSCRRLRRAPETATHEISRPGNRHFIELIMKLHLASSFPRGASKMRVGADALHGWRVRLRSTHELTGSTMSVFGQTHPHMKE